MLLEFSSSNTGRFFPVWHLHCYEAAASPANPPQKRHVPCTAMP